MPPWLADSQRGPVPDVARSITLPEILAEHARSRPERVAFTFLRNGEVEEDTLTFGELDARARTVARELRRHTAPGERALLLYPPGLEFIAAFFGCLYAGVVAVPSYPPRPNHSLQRLEAILRDAEAALLLTTEGVLPTLQPGLPKAGGGFPLALATDRLPTDPAAEGGEHLPDLHSLAFLQYTSGSTADPKGVMVTHGNLLENQHAIRRAMEHDDHTVFVGWLPLFHDMGLVGNLLQPVFLGIPCVLMAPVAFLQRPARWLEAISRYGATTSGGPNFAYDLCARKVSETERAALDLSAWKVAFNGAEPVRPATLEQFTSRFSTCGFRKEAFFPCYGMAETTLMAAGGGVQHAPRVLRVSGAALARGVVAPAGAGEPDVRELASCGPAVPEHELRVMDPERRVPAATGRIGEIWVAGPSVTAGYWRQPELTRESFGLELAGKPGEGFLRTGDLGFLQEGELYVTGRRKELIILRGRNYYPHDLEESAREALGFAANSCAAFALEDGDRERLAMVIEADRALVRSTRREPGEAKAELISRVDRVRHAVASAHEIFPELVVFVRPGTFPRTSSGKVQRLLCRTFLEQGELQEIHRSDLRRGPDAGERPTHPGAVPAELAPALDLGLPSAGSETSWQRAEALIHWFREYAERRLNCRLMDERRSVPPHVVLDFGNQGLFGLRVPEAYGGCGLTVRDTLRVFEQLAAVDVTLALLPGIHNGLGLGPILRAGSEPLKRMLLPALAAGRQLAAFALTEREAGSNPLSLQAAATRVPGGWRVTGEKQWIGLASWAGVITVFARAQDEERRPLGMVALAVPEATPGLSHGPEALTTGARAVVQNNVHLQGAFVPDEYRLGEPGQGMAIAQHAMQFCRLGLGAISLGAMKRCAQLMLRYASRRQVGTGLLLANPVTRTRLEELTHAIAAVEALVYTIADSVDQGLDLPEELFLACKVLAPELLWQAADELIQLLGGRGYMENSGVPQLLRDARLLRIFEGPTETLTMHLGAVVQRQGAGLPAFLTERLQAGDLAKGLIEAAQELEQVRAGAGPCGRQWAHYLTGQLAADTLLLAALRQAGVGQRSPGLEGALAWAQARHQSAQARARREVVRAATLCPPPELERRIRGYQREIGEVECRLPGVDDELDPLLARHPGHWHPVPVGRAEGSVPSTPGSLNGSNGCPEAGVKGTREVIQAAVLRWLRTELNLDVDAVDPEAPLTSLGLDSLGLTTLAAELEGSLGKSLTADLIYEYPSIGALSAYLDRSQDSSPRPKSTLGNGQPHNQTQSALAVNQSLAAPTLRSTRRGRERWSRYLEGMQRIRRWQRDGNYFYHSQICRQSGAWVELEGRQLLMLGSYSYLGLISHPSILSHSDSTSPQFGAGVHGVRLLAGTTSLHEALERKLAAWMNAEDAIVYSSGFVTNLATIAALVHAGDCVIGDEWNHASIMDGCRFSGAEVLLFRHNDLHSLEHCLIRAGSRHKLVVVDGVYSMEGDIAPLPEIVSLCRRYDALLMVDEAHSLGVLGGTGRGVQEHFGLPPDAIDVKMGTLSKTIPSAGGFIAGDADLINYLRHNARGYMFSSATPPGQVAAALAALDVLEQEPERIAQLWRVREQYVSGLAALGFDTLGSETPIVPIACGSEETTLEMTRRCRADGVYVIPVFYPAVPMNAPRLRTCVTAAHSEADIRLALEVLGKAGRATGLIPG